MCIWNRKQHETLRVEWVRSKTSFCLCVCISALLKLNCMHLLKSVTVKRTNGRLPVKIFVFYPHMYVFLFVASRLAACKHRLLEAARIDLGHSLMSVACGQKPTEDILAQKHDFNVNVLSQTFHLSATRMTACKCCNKLHLSSVQWCSKKGGFFSPTTVFVCLLLTSQSG